MPRNIFLLVLFATKLGLAQGADSVYAFVDDEPSFPGGDSAMTAFIVQNIIYPGEAIQKGESGIVYVQFVVHAVGQLTNFKIVRGVSESLDAESIRVISVMPDWNPGKVAGKSVASRFTLPINYQLDKNSTKQAQKAAKQK